MASQSGMNLIELCEISPPSGSVLPVSLPLTLFDVVWLPLPPVQGLFFFAHHCSKNQFTNTILPNIKHSLSLALQHFFPLAGNLTWPHDSSRPEIHYMDGDSVSFTVAESDYNFDILVRNDVIGVSRFLPLVPQLIKSSAEKRFPLTSLQVTVFPAKGISIGITTNHVVSDGRAINHFIETWASICRNIQDNTNSMVLQPPCFSRSLVKEEPNGETDMVVTGFLKKTNIARETFYNSNHHMAGTDKVFVTLTLGRNDISMLRERILANKKRKAQALHLSTFVLTCACVWVCSIKARRRESATVRSEQSEEDQMEYFFFIVDCRERLEAPLPVTYFGNCLRPVVVEAKLSDLTGEQGIAIAAELIGNAIRELENGNAILRYMERFLSSFNFPPRVLNVGGSTNFGTYD